METTNCHSMSCSACGDACKKTQKENKKVSKACKSHKDTKKRMKKRPCAVYFDRLHTLIKSQILLFYIFPLFAAFWDIKEEKWFEAEKTLKTHKKCFFPNAGWQLKAGLAP